MSDTVKTLNMLGPKVAHFLSSVHEAKEEILAMRKLLVDQWQASTALHSLKLGSNQQEFDQAIKEHHMAHKAIGDFLGYCTKPSSSASEES